MINIDAITGYEVKHNHWSRRTNIKWALIM